jgi:WD40 repeat protein
VRLWNVANHRPIGDPLVGFGSSAQVLVSADGRLLAVGGPGSSVDVWQMGRSPQYLFMLPAPAIVVAIAFSADSRTLAVESSDATIQLWDMRRQEPIGRPLKAPTYSWSIAFSPDGKQLVAADVAGSVWFCDVVHRRFLGSWLHTVYGGAYRVAFSPNGAVLATTGWSDDTVRLWDVARRQPIGLPLVGPTAVIRAIAFSPDGSVVAAGGQDNTVVLWDVATGQQLGVPLVGHTGYVESIAFSPDGTLIASGSDDATIRLWHIGLVAAPEQACRIAGRNLTLAEWRTYLGTIPYHETCPGLPAGSAS